MAKPITRINLKSLHEAIRAELRHAAKDIISDQRQSLTPIQSDLHGLREQMREAHTKLDAIMSGEVLLTRAQFSRLLERLRAMGISVDEREIFAS